MYEDLVKDLRDQRCGDGHPNHMYMRNEAANAIENLEKELRDCRNELCYKCGTYKNRHLGACDGCRWNRE